MRPKKLFQRWQRRRRRLLSTLPTLVQECRREGKAEQVHELRVTLRRLRLFVRLGRPLLDPSAHARFRTWAHRVSKLTSPVRDLDVALDRLRQEPNAAETVHRCEEARERSWQNARARLQPLPARLLLALGPITKIKDAADRLARRLRKRARRDEADARAALPRFFALTPLEQHAFRRSLRRWRYVRELTLSRRRQSHDPLLQTLIEAQEATGDRQNLMLALAALDHHCRRVCATELKDRLERDQVRQTAKIKKSLARLRLRPGEPVTHSLALGFGHGDRQSTPR